MAQKRELSIALQQTVSHHFYV